MSSARHDPSIQHEPQFKQLVHAGDPSEAKANKILSNEYKGNAEDQLAEHGVWDEPGLSMELSGKPPHDAVTYGRWLDAKILATSTGFSLLVTGLLITRLLVTGLIILIWLRIVLIGGILLLLRLVLLLLSLNVFAQFVESFAVVCL